MRSWMGANVRCNSAFALSSKCPFRVQIRAKSSSFLSSICFTRHAARVAQSTQLCPGRGWETRITSALSARSVVGAAARVASTDICLHVHHPTARLAPPPPAKPWSCHPPSHPLGDHAPRSQVTRTSHPTQRLTRVRW
jgi:hypothetical protein